MKMGSGTNSKKFLLVLAVLAVGFFAMPSTLSVYTGQHTFNKNGSADDFCLKCHGDVYNELTWNGYGGQAPPHTSAGLQYCKVCHRTGQLFYMAGLFKISGAPNVTLANRSGTHAAITVECIFCHDMVVSEINGSSEAHKILYNDANQSDLLKGGNEACVGCHTATRFMGNWVRKGGLNITADVTSGSWNLSVSVNQTNVTAITSGT